MIIEDKYNEGMTIKDMVAFTKKYQLPNGSIVGDKIIASINPCGFGFTFSLCAGKDAGQIEKEVLQEGASLKSSRGHFRIFKTIEPIVEIADNMGFMRCELWIG